MQKLSIYRILKKTWNNHSVSNKLLLTLALNFSWTPFADAASSLVWDTSTALRKTGYLDVTKAPYNLDNTGNINKAGTNRTQLQNAVNYAYDKNLVVFFPAGTYWLNNRITMDSDWLRMKGTQNDGKPWAHVLVGSADGANRPLIKLKNGSSGFGTATYNGSKALFEYIAADNPNDNNNLPDTNRLYNQAFRGIDIDLGNNPGACGLAIRSAEGSVAEDVRITGQNFFCGLRDLPGSGGSVTNIEVVGGKHGIYGHDAQANPGITGLVLKNQIDVPIISRLHGPLTVVGFDIENSTNKPSIRLIKGSHASAGHINLIDGIIRRSTNGRAVEDTDNGAVYMRNVYMKNAQHIEYDTKDTQARVTGTTGGWCHAKEYSGWFKIGNSKLIQNVHRNNEESTISRNIAANTVPSDLVTRHIWNEGTFPHFEGNVIDVTKHPYNIDPKNGTGSDLTKLQNAINAGNSQGKAVFLPKGDYFINGTLTLHANTKLFGVAKSLSRIRPTTGWAAGSLTPMIETPNNANTSLLLSTFMLEHPGNLTKKIYPLNWRSGGDAIYRGIWINRDGGGGSQQLTYKKVQFIGNAGGKIYNLVLNGSKKQTRGNNYRRFYVNNTAGNPLNIYTMTLQYGESNYQGEIKASSNVSIFSYKTETDLTLENGQFHSSGLLINNSDNIKIYGQSGNAEMNAGKGLIELSNGSTNILIANSSRWGGATVPTNSWYYIKDSMSGKNVLANKQVAFYKKGNPTDVHPGGSGGGGTSTDELTAWVIPNPPTSVAGNDVVTVKVKYSTSGSGNRELNLQLTKDQSSYTTANLAVDTWEVVPNNQNNVTHTFVVNVANGFSSNGAIGKWRCRLTNGSSIIAGTSALTQTGVTITNTSTLAYQNLFDGTYSSQFVSDFDGDTASFDYVGGTLRNNGNTGKMVTHQDGATWTDYDIMTKMRTNSGPTTSWTDAPAIVFRKASSTDYQAISIRGDNNKIIYSDSGSWKAASSTTFDQGSWVYFLISVSGSNVKVWASVTGYPDGSTQPDIDKDNAGMPSAGSVGFRNGGTAVGKWEEIYVDGH